MMSNDSAPKTDRPTREGSKPAEEPDRATGSSSGEDEVTPREAGTHQRVFLKDAICDKEESKRDRLDALEELSALDQELGLGY
jgi:hypothetical protein